jgi:hypothetical protein
MGVMKQSLDGKIAFSCREFKRKVYYRVRKEEEEH